MQFLFPSTCVFCNDISKRKIDLCVACEKDLPFYSACLNNKFSSVRIFTLFHYQTPIDRLIFDLKFNHHLVNAKILGKLLANYLYDQYRLQNKPEIIIPVPLHPARLRERGYNQALELARPITKKLKIKIDRLTIRRTKNTIAQALLPAKKRKQNIEHAFSAVEKISYQHVAIIDDVITTGNTISELCELLHQEGINKIDVWCVAKTQLR